MRDVGTLVEPVSRLLLRDPLSLVIFAALALIHWKLARRREDRSED